MPSLRIEVDSGSQEGATMYRQASASSPPPPIERNPDFFVSLSDPQHRILSFQRNSCAMQVEDAKVFDPSQEFLRTSKSPGNAVSRFATWMPDDEKHLS